MQAGSDHANLLRMLGLPYGLVVRIPAFHAGGPGSIPGVGTDIFYISCINFVDQRANSYRKIFSIKISNVVAWCQISSRGPIARSNLMTFNELRFGIYN